MRTHLIIRVGLLCGFAALLAACTVTAASTGSADMQVLAQGNHSGVRFQRMELIRTPAALQNLWAARFAPQAPLDPLPVVDFESEMVVAVFLGEHRTGGYSAAVKSVRDTLRGVDVDVIRTSPGAGCRRTQALTQPFVIVKVPRLEGAAYFNIQDVSRACH